MRVRAPTLAEFAAIVAGVAPRRRRIGAGTRLGEDLGFDLLALSDLDIVLFERYGGTVGFGSARPDLLPLTVRDARTSSASVATTSTRAEMREARRRWRSG